MQVFVFNPSTQRETLQAFNARVREHCEQAGVVNITAQAMGNNLILRVLTGEDMEEAGGEGVGAATLHPVVVKVSTKNRDDAMLEEDLSGVVEAQEALDDEDNANVPFDLLMVDNKNGDGGWAVFIIVNGFIEGEGPDEGEGDPQPVGPDFHEGKQS